MNLKTKLTTFFIGLVMVVSAQKNNYPASMIIKGDTVIAFTKEQALRLTEMNEENKTYKQILINKDSIIHLNSELLNTCKSIYSTTIQINEDYQNIITLKNQQIKEYSDNEKILNNEIKKQKRYKNYSLIGSGIVFVLSYLTFLNK